MEETILIAGTGPLHSRLIETCLDRQYRVISTALETESPGEREPGDQKVHPRHLALPWNPGSSLSPGNILLQAEHDSGPFKAAFLVFPSGRTSESFHEISSAAIQKILDYRVKSYLFFLRELIALFIRRGGGELNAVLHSEEGALVSPLVAGTYEMFRTMVRSCLSVYGEESFLFRGFESSSAEPEPFRDFIIEQTLDNPAPRGRLLSFPPRGGLFSRGSGSRYK